MLVNPVFGHIHGESHWVLLEEWEPFKSESTLYRAVLDPYRTCVVMAPSSLAQGACSYADSSCPIPPQ
jgi:hypothetical protein